MKSKEWVGFGTPWVGNVVVDRCENGSGWHLVLPVWETSRWTSVKSREWVEFDTPCMGNVVGVGGWDLKDLSANDVQLH